MACETPWFLEIMQLIGCTVFVAFSMFVTLGLLMLAGEGWRRFLEKERNDGE